MVYISKDKSEINIDVVKVLLDDSYWAKGRSEDIIRKSIDNSLCFGAYLKESKEQVGFARVITDYATAYYICDLIVDSNYRGNGVGKLLVDTIIKDEELRNMKAMLITGDAHGLYEQYGFCKDEKRFMYKDAALK